MKYINSNAYTIIAIEGLSFCQSAQKSFLIVMENALRIIAINSVGDFMLFLSKISVTTTTLLLAVIWLQVPVDNVIIHEKIVFYFC
jgi:solute carrier family 44 protein 1 (choline transporter-like protein)